MEVMNVIDFKLMKALRIEAGLTQMDMAERTGIYRGGAYADGYGGADGDFPDALRFYRARAAYPDYPVS